MIDIHCHILPGIDDGSKDFEESIKMAFFAAEEGVRTIVATPHVDDDSLNSETINDLTMALNHKLKVLSIPIEIIPGAEISYVLPEEFIKNYTINNNGYVLIEFPHSHLPAGAVEKLLAITSHGMKPIIAHPERNPSVIKNPGLLSDLAAETGAAVQVTAASIAGDFGRRIQMCSHHLLKKGIVDLIASDAHSMRFRPPSMNRGLRAAGRLIGRKHVEKLTIENPKAVINGLSF